MEDLIALLRGQSVAPEATDWDALLAQAGEQHLLPMAAGRLLASPDTLPAEVLARLQSARRDAILAAFFWTAELRGLLRAFAAERIAVILLKGPSLAERLYGGTALRTSQDLDLLVRKPDYAAAESLLDRLGFAPHGLTDDYHRQWRRQTCTVELHFDIENPLAIDFDIAGAWRQAIPGEFAGQPCRLLAPPDELLFLCIHGVRHRFERLNLVLDIALALDQDGKSLPLRPEVASLERLLVLGLAMAAHLRPGHTPPSNLGPAQRAHIVALADQLWLELTEGTPKPLDWVAQHDFFLATEVTPTRRLLRRAAHLRIAATRLIDPDFAFAQSFGLHRRWQVWMLRPVRLILSRWLP
jgi:hypothetical protein